MNTEIVEILDIVWRLSKLLSPSQLESESQLHVP
jgi:hypothetical protein